MFNFFIHHLSIASKTAVVLLLLFTVSGLAIFAIERMQRKADDNLRKRFFSWLVMAPIVLLPAYLGGFSFALLVIGLSLWSLREFFKIANVWDTPSFKWIGRVSGTALVMAAAAQPSSSIGNESGTYPASVPIFYILPVFVIMLVLAAPVALRRYQGMLVREAFTIFGILYFGWFLAHLIFLRQMVNGFGFVIFLAMVVIFNDVLAYTTGRLFGRNLLLPAISPKKTVEGFIGGVIGSLAASLLFWYAVPTFSIPQVLVSAFLIGIAAPLGDLIISVIKRDMSVKDSGNLIPGHGGLLDRLDSLIFATPLFYYYILLSRPFFH